MRARTEAVRSPSRLNKLISPIKEDFATDSNQPLAVCAQPFYDLHLPLEQDVKLISQAPSSNSMAPAEQSIGVSVRARSSASVRGKLEKRGTRYIWSSIIGAYLHQGEIPIAGSPILASWKAVKPAWQGMLSLTITHLFPS